jgi:hypothetical protein
LAYQARENAATPVETVPQTIVNDRPLHGQHRVDVIMRVAESLPAGRHLATQKSWCELPRRIA